MGYMGATTGDVVTGTLLSAYDDWHIPVRFWAACAFGAAILMLFLWNAKASED